VIKTGSLSKYLNSNGGNTNGLEFKPGDFTIVFNNQTYDLSKNSDGTNFKLTGKTEEELLQNLANHINSKGIEGLKVKVESYNQNNVTGFRLNFSGDGSSDFSIKGDANILKELGLSDVNITSKPIEGKGIFSKLKATLQEMTGKDGSITKYDESLTNDIKSLNTSKDSTQAMIDTRYDTMANQWLQYESILNKLNQQLNTVTNMINA
ncbi:flagellar capping protein, partial [Salmonella enterica subsp. enterica serovar Mississippi]|nr:flagellar capping protein [Salmonella enterica subsp. enterica serovar Mississippi]